MNLINSNYSAIAIADAVRGTTLYACTVTAVISTKFEAFNETSVIERSEIMSWNRPSAFVPSGSALC